MHARLRDRFAGVVGKRLAVVECVAEGVSNQQELNAGRAVRELLGGSRLQNHPCHYLYLDTDGTIVEDERKTITYYDARQNQPHRAAEYRLTYPNSVATMAQRARAGDLCWLVRHAREAMGITVIVTPPESGVAIRLDRILGTGLQPHDPVEPHQKGRVFDAGTLQFEDDFVDEDDLGLLEILGVEVEVRHQDHVQAAIALFGGEKHPTALEFSTFARSRCVTADPVEDPDRTLYDWYTFTYDLFLGYEEHLLQPVLDGHFANQEHIDVHQFFQVAKRLTNSRFSRAGGSFEAQVSALFSALGINYTAQSKGLPDGSKPDFLLPGRRYYDSPDPDVLPLVTFLGAKTTTRERWLQLVAEAQLVDTRHMMTMDKGLNRSKVETMGKKNVVPVLPRPVVDEYYANKPWSSNFMSVREFTDMALERQAQLDKM